MNSEETAAATAAPTAYDVLLNWVSFGANVAAIVTAIVAVSAWLWFRRGKKQRRIRLEEYLKEAKAAADDQARRTVLHLMANLRMTEAQVFEAAFDSKHIMTSPGQDHTGIANRIYFEYTTGDAAGDFDLVGLARRRSLVGRPYAR